MKHTDTYLKNVPLYVESEIDLEEMEYTWALWDISPFVVKYGINKVLSDIQDHIACRDQNGF